MMMNSHQNQHPNSIEQARDLLSPYIDGEVTSAERELVETMLAQSPDLQAELESLRQTVALVGRLSRAPAPRPFTLNESDVGLSRPKKESSFRSWFKPLLGAAAALAAVFVVGLLFVLNSRPPGQEAAQIALAPAVSEVAQPAKMEAETASEPAAEAQKAPALREQPAAEMEKGAAVEDAAEVEKESEAAFSAATSAPEPAATPLSEGKAEAPVAVERMAADSAGPMEKAAEEEALAGAVEDVLAEAAASAETGAPAETALAEAPAPMDAVGGAAKSLAEVTATLTESGGVEEQSAPGVVAATQSVEAVTPGAEARSTPATTTLFIPLAAQKMPIGGGSAAGPTPAGASPEAPSGTPAGQTQQGAMTLATGLAVAGLILVIAVGVFLFISKKK